MSKRFPRFLLALAIASIAIPQVASGQPTIKVKRRGPKGQPPPPPPPPVDVRPSVAPPEIRIEKFNPRKGYTWVGGHWDWKGGQWTWVAGHFERERRGKRWRPHRWEAKGGVWIRVNGDWDAAPDFPTAAPPVPQNEQNKANNPKPGKVWVLGHWEWRDYDWKWIKGHWDDARPGKRYVAGKWEQKGDRWVWTDDDWIDAPHPTTAPPAPIAENKGTRAGFVWVMGHYEWQNGEYRWEKGHWEKLKPSAQWTEGRWEQQGQKWVWVPGAWKDVVIAEFPTLAPPAPRPEKIGMKRGYVWVTGFYQWKNGQYEWIPGHWERFRAKKKWMDGRWEQQGQKWVWVDGSWGDDAPAWKFEAKGWTLLGSQDVMGKTDRDTIMVGKYQGRFDQLTMVVTDSDLQLDDFVVTFGNGEQFTPKIKVLFKEGSRSRAIDLPGDDRFIQKIELRYSNLPGGGRAHVDIYGRDTGKARPTTPPPATTTGTTTGGTTTTTTSTSTTTTTTTSSSGPTEAPPALRPETVAAKAGYVWAKGAWRWKAGKWEWLPGHWERARAQKTWHDGRWDKKGNVWVWVEGGWR